MPQLPDWLPSSVDESKLDELTDLVERESFRDGSLAALRDHGFYSPRNIQDFVVYLTREGLLETARMPQLWGHLGRAADRLDTSDLTSLLAGIEYFDVMPDDYDGPIATDESFPGDRYLAYLSDEPKVCITRKLVPWWPSVLDEMVLPAYRDDPDAFLQRRDEFSDAVNRGLDLVEYRCGDIDAWEAPREALDGIAASWMAKTLPSWFYTGALDQWGQNLEYTYLVRSEKWSEQGLRELVEIFGDWKDFGESLLAQARLTDGDLSAADTYLAWPAADSDELVELWSRTTFDDPSRALEVLLEERQDSVEELDAMSQQFEEAGEPVKAEFTAIATIRRAAQQQRAIPENVESRLELALLDDHLRPAHHPASAHVLHALAALPDERQRAWFESQFERNDASKAVLYVMAPIGRQVPLDERLFDRIDGWDADGEDRLAVLESFALGMGGIGPRALDWLDESMSATDSPLAADAFRLAAMHIIADHARHGVEWPAAHDHFLSYTDWNDPLFADSLGDWKPGPDDEDAWFGELVRDHLEAAVSALPPERAEALLAEQLDSESDMWERALSALPKLPQPPAARLIERATERLEVASTTLYWAEANGETASDQDLNRIGGRPIGIADWPCVGHDARFGPQEEEDDAWAMEHLFTLDLADAPGLRGEIDGSPRAFAFFAWHPEEFEEGDRTAVVMLDEDAVASGEYSGELPAGEDSAPMAFRVEAFRAPSVIFSEEATRRPDQLEPALGAIREAVYLLNARLGGEPIWLHDAPYGFDEADPGEFLMQFDSGFVPREMLDIFGNGVMYLFERVVEAQA